MKRFLVLFLFAMCVVPAAYAAEATADDGWAAYQAGDYDKAKAISEPLAAKGDSEAMVTLSFMHQHGKGYPKSEEERCKWLKKAEEAGNFLAKTTYMTDCGSQPKFTAEAWAKHKAERKAKEALGIK